MKILVIGTDSGESAEHLKATQQLLRQAASDDVEIDVVCQEQTLVCVDSSVDVAITTPEALLRAKQAEDDGYDAIGIYCGADPGLEAMRELVSIPVVGAARASFATAMMLGYQYSLIVTSKRRIPQKREFARCCGIDYSRLVSVRSIEYDFAASKTREYLKQTVSQLANAARLCVEEDSADVIVLGCLSFSGMAAEISKHAGVPVIDPGFAMITMAEALVRQKISHSKIAYPKIPEGLNRSWSRGMLNT